VTTNRPVRRWIGTALPMGLACLAVGLASGCSSAASGAAGGTTASPSAVPSAYATPTGTACGTSRTIINTPVVIKVTKGTVSCATAVAIENGYTTALKNGALKGNGGGAPVAVSGWTCQGYPTPQVLKNGVTSECHTASADVIEVLDLSASASPSPSAGS
jgi:hypothetical protein